MENEKEPSTSGLGTKNCRLRELEKRFRKEKTGTLQEPITFNEARSSGQISESLH